LIRIPSGAGCRTQILGAGRRTRILNAGCRPRILKAGRNTKKLGAGYGAAILDVRFWRRLVFLTGFESPDVAPGTVGGGGSLVFPGRAAAEAEREAAGDLSDTGYDAGQQTDDTNA
jgi:hypothetical protein